MITEIKILQYWFWVILPSLTLRSHRMQPRFPCAPTRSLAHSHLEACPKRTLCASKHAIFTRINWKYATGGRTLTGTAPLPPFSQVSGLWPDNVKCSTWPCEELGPFLRGKTQLSCGGSTQNLRAVHLLHRPQRMRLQLAVDYWFGLASGGAGTVQWGAWRATRRAAVDQ